MKGKRWAVPLGWAAGAAALAVMVALVGAGMAAAAPPGPAPYPPGVVVYWVNDPGDAMDADGAGVCDVTVAVTPLPGTGREPCTLRAAIQLANSDGVPSVIAFEVCSNDTPWSGSGGQMPASGAVIIQPGWNPLGISGPLPAIMDDYSTYINGYTQGYPSPTPGYDDPAIPPAPGSCVAPLFAMPNTASFGTPMNTVLAVDVEGSLCVPPAPAPGSSVTAVPGGIVPSGSILQWNGVQGACSGFTVLSSQNVIAGLNIQQ
ncbi:MAG TPA: hypothetical protein PKH77_26830, partial [Anaerolineae bacterium]|nr:hypothetical protein [Anaerolineae bacterium]